MKSVFDQWLEAKALLDNVKKLERELRDEIVAKYFDTEHTGTQKTSAEGCNLKVTIPKNFTVDQSIPYDVVRESGGAIKHKFQVSAKEFDALAIDKITELSDWVTLKPGAPSLTITPIEEE